jgi:hypothetical protein
VPGIIPLTSEFEGSDGGDMSLYFRLCVHSDSVPIDHYPAGDRRDTLARNDNSNQIQRVGGRDRDNFPGGRELAGCPQRLNRGRQSKLLSQESIHEAAAADLATGF